jgi:hypothetical protein
MGLARCVIEERHEERTKIESNRDIQESRKRINGESDPIVELARPARWHWNWLETAIRNSKRRWNHDRRGIEATS